MFLGKYEHALDNKNRLRIPSKFRKEFVDGMVLTKSNNGCLLLISKSSFENILQKISNFSLFDNKLQNPLRILFSSAVEIEEDNQGRFLLPGDLKNFANISKNITSIGVGSRVEIWASEKWQNFFERADDFDSIFAELSEYGI